MKALLIIGILAAIVGLMIGFAIVYCRCCKRLEKQAQNRCKQCGIDYEDNEVIF